jgi:folate-binding protein YgfZ
MSSSVGSSPSAGPLEAMHLARGAHFFEYAGKRTPAHYGDVSDEYRTVRESVGITDLSVHGRLEIGGKERAPFINGLVSHHVKSLKPGAGVPALFLTAQGKVVADCTLLAADDAFWIFTDAATHEKLYKKLFALTYAGDFKVADRTKTHGVIGLHGPRSRALLSAVAECDVRDWPATQTVEKVGGGGTEEIAIIPHRVVSVGDAVGFAVLHRRFGVEACDLVFPNESAAAVWEALERCGVSFGARPVGFDALEVARIEAGVGRYGADFDEQTLAPEAGLHDAVSYTKGCFVGQETIAKIHWRGHDQVARKLVRLSIAGDGVPSPGAPLLKGEKEVGLVTSVTREPLSDNVIALGYVRSSAIAPGAELAVKIGDATLTAAIRDGQEA